MEINMETSEMRVLADGNLIPYVGFGTYKLLGDDCINAVSEAISAGYRFIDTAEFYNNEESVGKGIKKSGIPREEIFVASKVWVDSQEKEIVREAFMRSLEKLDLDYLDLYMIHWPVRNKTLKAYKILEELKNEGLIKSLGVCNMDIPHLKDLLYHTDMKPVVNQIEVNPYNNNLDIVKFCRENDVLVQGWRPLMKGAALKDIPEITGLAEKYGKMPSQITLRWVIQNKVSPVVKSSDPQRMRKNLEIFDFELDEDDMNLMESLNQNKSSAGMPKGTDYE